MAMMSPELKGVHLSDPEVPEGVSQQVRQGHTGRGQNKMIRISLAALVALSTGWIGTRPAVSRTVEKAEALRLVLMPVKQDVFYLTETVTRSQTGRGSVDIQVELIRYRAKRVKDKTGQEQLQPRSVVSQIKTGALKLRPGVTFNSSSLEENLDQDTVAGWQPEARVVSLRNVPTPELAEQLFPVPLPEEAVVPGQRWHLEQSAPFMSSDVKLFRRVDCRLAGEATYRGRACAKIVFEEQFRFDKGKAPVATSKGLALFDLKAGMFVKLKAKTRRGAGGKGAVTDTFTVLLVPEGG